MEVWRTAAPLAAFTVCPYHLTTNVQVYDKAVQTVPEDARLAIYDRYLKRASTFFGIAKARMRIAALAEGADGPNALSLTR